jgi:hypothetical protein
MGPNHVEVSNLAHILNNFSNVTDLLTIFEKSLVATIRWNEVDLVHVLQDLSATTTSFPMKYLGLPILL